MTHEQETSVLIDMEAALSAPPISTPPALPKNNMKLARFLATIAALLGLYWYSDIILHYASADAECLKFANEAEIEPATHPDPNDKKIFVANKWIRNGHVVVELGQKVANKKGYYQSRLCVIGSGQIQIPGLFEQWQYR